MRWNFLDQATFASWHDFYLTIEAASASLIGLLFVALRPSTASPWSYSTTYGVAFVALAVGGAYRMLRRAPAVWRGRRRDRLGEGVVWRFVLPAAALFGLIASSLGLMVGQPSALYWFVAVIIGLLMSAARLSWDLLVEVGDSRRGTTTLTRELGLSSAARSHPRAPPPERAAPR